jgi:hypothetical protein
MASPTVPSIEPREPSSFPVALIIGVIVVALIVAGITIAARVSRKHSPQGEQHLPFGPAEQAAAARLHFLDLQMSRASNFLNQDVTYVAGVLENSGVDDLDDVEVTMEFHDPFKQVILRETRRLFGPNTPVIQGGTRRDFQISLEYIPEQWDQQYPSIRVVGVQLAK